MKKQLEPSFLPEFKEPMLAGRKTATSRTKRLGRVGQKFKAFGAVFEFTAIQRMPLRWVRDIYWADEGVASPAAFVEVYGRIHPRRGFIETDKVWIHFFRKVS
jgi:hypothetical protein